MVQPQPPKSCRARSLGQPGQVASRPRPPCRTAAPPDRRTAGPTAQHNNAQKTSPVQREVGQRRRRWGIVAVSCRALSLAAATGWPRFARGPLDRLTAGPPDTNCTTQQRPEDQSSPEKSAREGCAAESSLWAVATHRSGPTGVLALRSANWNPFSFNFNLCGGG